eukprot:TRINITY_DN19950_c0_g1_i2.p1 TRINITY_DN19950_c0_g1~~TRINITY_DN19950_c0_g1_i2.p1  ORF type:complete len:705 (+),score=246.74 TRINITY_DN19950_c0_g1_i2:83-2116(+)
MPPQQAPEPAPAHADPMEVDRDAAALQAALAAPPAEGAPEQQAGGDPAVPPEAGAVRALTLRVNRAPGARIGWTRDCATMELTAVAPDSAAAAAGLVPGMRLLAVDGVPVSNDEECSKQLQAASASFDVTVALSAGAAGVEQVAQVAGLRGVSPAAVLRDALVIAQPCISVGYNFAATATQNSFLVTRYCAAAAALGLTAAGAAAASTALAGAGVAAAAVAGAIPLAERAALAAIDLHRSAVEGGVRAASGALQSVAPGSDLGGGLASLAGVGGNAMQELTALALLASRLWARHGSISPMYLLSCFTHLSTIHRARPPPSGRRCPPGLLKDCGRHFRFAAAAMGPTACMVMGITPLQREGEEMALDGQHPPPPPSPTGSCKSSGSGPPPPAAEHGLTPPAERFAASVSSLCGIRQEDVVHNAGRGLGAVFQPARMVCRDAGAAEVVIALRGSMSAGDVITDLSCEETSVRLVGGVGRVHRGFLASAEAITAELERAVRSVIQPGDAVVFTGHSLGAAVAAVLCELWHHRATFPGHKIKCYSFAAPCCFDRETALSATPRVVSLIVGDDVVPRLSLGSAERLAASLASVQSALEQEQEPPATHAALHADASERLARMDCHAPHIPAGVLVHIGKDGVPRICEDPEEFEEMRINPSEMFSSHLPNAYFGALHSLHADDL